jgi:hypothetical protein
MSARLHLAAIAAAAFLLLPAAPAAASWTNPFPVGNLGGDNVNPSVCLAADGTAVITYGNAGGGALMATREADGTTTPQQTVGDFPAVAPTCSSNAVGRTALSWLQSDNQNVRVHVRVRAPDGTMTADQLVSQEGFNAQQPEVGIDDAGNVLLSWVLTAGGDHRTFVRTRAPGGTLGPVQRVSPEHGTFGSPHLAVAPDGRAFITWTATDAAGNAVLSGRTRGATGTLGSPVTLSGPPAPITQSSLSINAAGTALVAWLKTIGGESRVQARTRPAGGGASAIATLSRAGASADGIQARLAATGGSGEVAWRRVITPNARLQTRRVTGNGVWAPDIQNVSPVGMDVLDFRLGLSADAGRAVFVFASRENGGADQVIRARQRAPDGTYGPPDFISAFNQKAASAPRVAVDASGKAVAVWLQPLQFGLLAWTAANFL